MRGVVLAAIVRPHEEFRWSNGFERIRSCNTWVYISCFDITLLMQTLWKGDEMIVATLAEKGGVGKTMLATNLAGMRSARGYKVLIVDADRQGASDAWAQLRLSSNLPAVRSEARYGRPFAQYVSSGNRIDAYDDVILDLDKGDSIEVDAALKIADCAIVPVRPTMVDLRTVGLIDLRVGEGQEENPKLRAYAVLNAVHPNPRHRAEKAARNALDAGCVSLEVAPVAIRDRVAFQRAFSLGQTIEEYGDGREKGVAEVASLYESVFGESFQHSGASRNGRS